MTDPVKFIEEVDPASSPQSSKKTWLRWYLWVPLALIAFITVTALIIFGHAADQNTQQPGSTTRPGPGTTSVVTPSSTPEPTSPAEQARAFYGAPDSFVSKHLAAYTNDGGDSWKGHPTDDNYKIISNFNYWWQVGCRNPEAWQQVLYGLVDVHSSFYQQWKNGPDDAPQCAFPFEGGYGGSDVGTNPRIVGVKLSEHPGDGVQTYSFIFAADPTNPGVGVWLLSDSASSQPTDAVASPALTQQVTSFYGSPVVLSFSDEMGKASWSNTQIVTSFNSWVERACSAPGPGDREVMLDGVVDAQSSYWTTYSTEADCASLQFNLPAENGTGTSRMISVDLAASPGFVQPYHFVFVAKPGSPEVGAWILTDGD